MVQEVTAYCCDSCGAGEISLVPSLPCELVWDGQAAEKPLKHLSINRAVNEKRAVKTASGLTLWDGTCWGLLPTLV